MNTRKRCVLLLLASLCILPVIAAGGCGKKGDPRYTGNGIAKSAPERVSDLRAVIEDGAPLLQWTGNWGNPDEMRFTVLRSALRPGDCRDCPHDFSVLEEGIGGEVLQSKTDKGEWRYRDVSADKEGTYLYKVVVCDRRGNCSSASNEVEADVQRRSK